MDRRGFFGLLSALPFVRRKESKATELPEDINIAVTLIHKPAKRQGVDSVITSGAQWYRYVDGQLVESNDRNLS